ncbi:MAG: BatA domain-containing protein [bacterium]
MTFLNPLILIGLAAIAIPILIHLLNRSKPRPIEWGAMQFLRASMTARSRRVKIEDGILLCLRCLALATLALAMARPFLPSMSAIPWILILPGIFLAVLCAGIATVLWPNEKLRRRLLKIAAAMLVIAVLATLLEQRIQARRWMTAAGGGDTVIVLDASLSMTMASEGPSQFTQAVQEARDLIEKSRPGDAMAIILAGPVPQALVSRPTSDRRELLRALDSKACKPTGSIMATLEALNLATSILADGPNVSKTVVIFTDGQAAGWDGQTEARWNFLASGFKQLPTPPRIICRRLPHPELFRNTLVTGIRLSRSIIGTDRPVKIEVSVANSGNVPVHPSALELLVDGKQIERTPIMKDLVPQAAEVFLFNHMFETPGYHVIQARLVAEDDLLADNSLEQIVHILDRLPILLVEGASTERFFFRKTASLIRVALTPRDASANKSADTSELPYLVKPTIVEAADIGTIKDLTPYRVIILADVSRLPAAEAERVAVFVKAGGGLLVTPGARAEPAFYNAWQTTAGETLLPARLEQRIYPPDPLKLELKSFTHPAVRLVAQPDQSDARLGLIASYWEMGLDPASNESRVGGRLESGAPWLLERPLGKGNVLMTPMAFDRRDSNLYSLKCFVPLLHEMVYFLATSSLQDCNIMPGTEWTLAGVVPADVNNTADWETATVTLPAGEQLPIRIKQEKNRFIVRCGETRQPGIYRVQFPAALAAAAGVASNGNSEVLFAVKNQPEESTLTFLSDADIAAIRSHVDLFLPKSLDELLTAFTGNIPGQELWKILVICALFTLLAEVTLTRWITLHRHLHQAKPVTLKSPAESVQATKTRLTELMSK